MSFLRPLLIVAVIGAAIVSSIRLTTEHQGGIFQTLYMHLMPAPLVHGGESEHPEPLVQLPLPASLSAFRMDHGSEGGPHLVMTNLQIFQIAAVLLIFVCFLGVPNHLRTGRGDILSRLFAGAATWIRDEMVFPVMGRESGQKLLPMFLSIFFFILFMNVLGLVPGAATATASIFVTGAMAAITFATMIVGGMVVQGPIAFWKHLVPHVPLALWPLMFAVELVGLFVKPIALMIRLFANMTGGHLAVLSLMGLVFFFGALNPVVGWASSPVAVGLAVFILIIESFVALLQAYIFTTLSIIFVQASLHPEH
jgi:F-type H+-transporting ATPase subunit a